MVTSQAKKQYHKLCMYAAKELAFVWTAQQKLAAVLMMACCNWHANRRHTCQVNEVKAAMRSYASHIVEAIHNDSQDAVRSATPLIHLGLSNRPVALPYLHNIQHILRASYLDLQQAHVLLSLDAFSGLQQQQKFHEAPVHVAVFASYLVAIYATFSIPDEQAALRSCKQHAHPAQPLLACLLLLSQRFLVPRLQLTLQLTCVVP